MYVVAESEMDICHSSILKFLQLGVEIPDSFFKCNCECKERYN